MSKVFTPHQGNFSLQEINTTTERHSPSNAAVEPSPLGYIYKMLLHLRLPGNTVEEEGGKIVRDGGPGVWCEIVSPSNIKL